MGWSGHESDASDYFGDEQLKRQQQLQTEVGNNEQVIENVIPANNEEESLGPEPKSVSRCIGCNTEMKITGPDYFNAIQR